MIKCYFFIGFQATAVTTAMVTKRTSISNISRSSERLNINESYNVKDLNNFKNLYNFQAKLKENL